MKLSDIWSSCSEARNIIVSTSNSEVWFGSIVNFLFMYYVKAEMFYDVK